MNLKNIVIILSLVGMFTISSPLNKVYVGFIVHPYWFLYPLVIFIIAQSQFVKLSKIHYFFIAFLLFKFVIGWRSGALFNEYKYLLYYLFPFFLSIIYNSEKEVFLKWLTRISLFLAIINVVPMLVHMLGGVTFLSEKGILLFFRNYRYSGLFVNCHAAAEASLICLYPLVVGPDRRGNLLGTTDAQIYLTPEAENPLVWDWRKEKYALKKISFYIHLLVIFCTLSKSLFLALFSMCIPLLWSKYCARKKYSLKNLLFSMFIFFSLLTLLASLTSLSGRTEMWKRVISYTDFWSSEFLLGRGSGFSLKNSYSLGVHTAGLHNSYLEIFFENGIVALFCYGVFVFYVVLDNLKTDQGVVKIFFLMTILLWSFMMNIVDSPFSAAGYFFYILIFFRPNGYNQHQ